jgi:hypothetical protein
VRLGVFLTTHAPFALMMDTLAQLTARPDGTVRGVTVEPLQLLGIQPTQHPRRKPPLEQPSDPTRALPARLQPHPTARHLRVTTQVVTIEEPASDSVSARLGSGSATRIRKLRARPRRSSGSCARCWHHATLLDPELRERWRQDVRVVAVEVGTKR